MRQRLLAGLVLLLASPVAQAQFTALDRQDDSSRAGLRFDLSLSEEVDNVFPMRIELYGQYFFGDFGAYGSLPLGFAFFDERDDETGVGNIEIERASERLRVIIHTSRPGVIIGRRGADIDRLKTDLQDLTGNQIYIDIKEIKRPAADAQLVAENIAFQLIKRIAFRRAMKRAVQMAMDAGAEGIKVKCAGRLGGIEMARKETYKEGKIPLQTFRSDIDYGFTEAHTTYGSIGVKVWISKGEALQEKERGEANRSQVLR